MLPVTYYKVGAYGRLYGRPESHRDQALDAIPQAQYCVKGTIRFATLGNHAQSSVFASESRVLSGDYPRNTAPVNTSR
jgi:hypothetical protein